MASFAPVRGTRTQIQSTPIVDGQFLIETDQGVGNKIYMDVNATRTEVGGNSISGVLPELYIYSETGSVVTVKDSGGNTVPSSQIGTDHWICEVPDYGVYTVYSVLSGETTTKSINVDDCMIYTIDDSHFHSNIQVTYPSGVGASCSCSGGGETFSAPALNPPDTSYTFVVHGKSTTYTITTNVDGSIKTKTVTTGTTLDETFQVSMPYARINLTVEAPPMTGNVTCSNGIKTITKPVTPNMVFYVPDEGTWTFTGSDGTETYTVDVEVDDLSSTYSQNLRTVPNGSQVLPINNVRIWLECAAIDDLYSYTTLDEVLGDRQALATLMSDENACNYLVRSTEFISAKELVPKMTSNTLPEGQCFCSFTPSGGAGVVYYAFDRDESTTLGDATGGTANDSVGYTFTSPKIVKRAVVKYNWGGSTLLSGTLYFEGSNDNFTSDINILGSETFTDISSPTVYTTEILAENNSTAYQSYRIRRDCATVPSANRFWYNDIQFYPAIFTQGIIESNLAMRYIGKRNYCSNLLLSDSDWADGISNSDYWSLVLNQSVPNMTSATQPSGEVTSSSDLNASYAGWYAFSTSAYGWIPAANDNEPWIQYDFGFPVKVTKISTKRYSAAAGSTFGVKIVGSNDNFVTEHVLTTDAYVLPDASVHYYTFANDDYYRYYRLVYISHTTIWNVDYGVDFNFYGHKEVDESLISVYSAANDTLTVSTTGGASVIVQTDNSGYGEMLAPSYGTYSFISTNAKTPNTGANYQKMVDIDANTIEIFVMPDNALYWFGYSDMQIMKTADGWSGQNDEGSSISVNLRDVTFAWSTGTSIGGMGCIYKVYNAEKLNIMATATSGSNYVYVMANNKEKMCMGGTATSEYVFNRFGNLDSTYQIFTYTLPNSHKDVPIYVAFGKPMSGYSVSCTVHAFWYE